MSFTDGPLTDALYFKWRPGTAVTTGPWVAQQLTAPAGKRHLPWWHHYAPVSCSEVRVGEQSALQHAGRSVYG